MYRTANLNAEHIERLVIGALEFSEGKRSSPLPFPGSGEHESDPHGIAAE
jgi:hypothetical protein